MSRSQTTSTLLFLVSMVGVMAGAAGCPRPGPSDPFRVLLVNGTDETVIFLFNVAVENPTAEYNRIDLDAQSTTVARISEDDFEDISHILVLASTTGIAFPNPLQSAAAPVPGGQAAFLVTAAGTTGEFSVLTVAGDGF